jgi:predicted nucleic acid-binding protein
LKKGLLEIEPAFKLIELAEQQLRGNEYLVDSKNVLMLSNNSGCSVYDCEFAYLAKEFSVKLCTTDKKLLKSFPDITLNLREI